MTQGPTGRRSDTAIRDHLANVRTYLAWVWTAATFVGLGFAVDRPLLAAATPLRAATPLAVVVVGGGLALVALSLVRGP